MKVSFGLNILHGDNSNLTWRLIWTWGPPSLPLFMYRIHNQQDIPTWVGEMSVN